MNEQHSNPPVVSLVSLGCAKNTVDSELILGRFVESGWMIAEDPAQADVCLVNTCGFINDAREEAAAVLRELAKLKADSSLQAVVALGCLVKRVTGAPELDGFLACADARAGFDDYARLPDICLNLLGEKPAAIEAEGYTDFLLQPRLRMGATHTAWLKISEGCSNPCSFCSIPQIRGKQISRPPADIFAEAQALIESGAREISLIAQDTTSYGRDWDGNLHLPGLLNSLTKIEADVWFRLMYAYPMYLTEEVLKVLAGDPRFCPYIDLPLQHISDPMLAAMGRKMTKAETLAKLDLIERIIPGCSVRTAFIVGYPGETEADFAELLEWVEQGRFTHMGIFLYSPEPGTPAARLNESVPLELKEKRRAQLMEAQRTVSARRLRTCVGKKTEVLVDGEIPPEFEAPKGCTHIARSQCEAPEVDGVIFLRDVNAEPGDRLQVRVAGSLDYDLIAEKV